MKYALIAMGLILIAGGVKAVNDPRSMMATMGGNKATPTMSYREISPQGSHFMGYTSIALGLGFIGIGFSSKYLFGAPRTGKRKLPKSPNRRAPPGNSAQ